MADGADKEEIDGFYSAYFAGKSGNGFGMFVLWAGRVVGADPMGVSFDGDYTPKVDGTGYEGTIRILIPPGGTTVQGVMSGPDGVSYSIPLTLPRSFDAGSFIRFETPLGPVNVRFVKLRSIDV